MFDRVTGQKKALQNLQADLETERLADSYLFCGPEGTGKRFVALELAKAILCVRSRRKSLLPENAVGPVPCGQCPACKRIEEQIHPDVFVLDFDTQAQILDLDEEDTQKQKEFSIKAVRILLDRAHISALEGPKKIFIIDGVEFLSPAAANCLLKVLEESPRHALWVSIARSPERVILTIRSRCRKVWFSPLSSSEIQAILLKETGKAYGPETIAKAADFSNGSLTWARALLNWDTLRLAKLVETFLELKGSHPADALRISQGVVSDDKKLGSKKSAGEFLRFLSLKLEQRLEEHPTPNRAQALLSALESQQLLQRNVSPQMVLDSLLLSLQARP